MPRKIMTKLLGILFCIVCFASLDGMMDDAKSPLLPQDSKDTGKSDQKKLCPERPEDFLEMASNTYKLYKAIYNQDTKTACDMRKKQYLTGFELCHIDMFIQRAYGYSTQASTIGIAFQCEMSPIWFATWLMVTQKIDMLPMIKQLWDDTQDAQLTGPLGIEDACCDHVNRMVRHTCDGDLLHFAAQQDQIELMRWLVVEKKVYINARDTFGRTALSYALARGSEQAVKLLVDNDAEVGDIGGGCSSCCDNGCWRCQCLVPAGSLTNNEKIKEILKSSQKYEKPHWMWSLLCCSCSL